MTFSDVTRWRRGGEKEMVGFTADCPVLAVIHEDFTCGEESSAVHFIHCAWFTTRERPCAILLGS